MGITIKEAADGKLDRFLDPQFPRFLRALAEIRDLERALKRRLAGIARRMARRILENQGARGVLAALREQMKIAILTETVRAWAAGWTVAHRRVQADLLRSQFRETAQEDDAPDIPQAWRRWYEDTLDQALARYTERLRKEIGDLSIESALNGWTVTQHTEAVEQLVRGMATWQAERIARTETMRLWNLGHYGRMETEGEELIGYAYSVVLDDRTSHYCRPLAGKTVRREALLYLPPLHPHCRTILEPIYSFDMDAAEIEWSDPGIAAGVPGFGAIPLSPGL